MKVFLFKKSPIGSERQDICRVPRFVPLALLVIQGGDKGSLPCLYIHRMTQSGSHGLYVTFSSGKAIQVFILRVTAGKREHVINICSGNTVRWGDVQTMHDTMNPSGIVHLYAPIHLSLQITVITNRKKKVLTQCRRCVGVIDKATRGI